MNSYRVYRDRVAVVPVIETPGPKNARTGFFERDEFEAVAEHLQGSCAAVARFGYLTGWRVRSEVLGLRWDQIDFKAGTVRLEPDTTKSGRVRTFTFDALPGLAALLNQERCATNGVIAASGRRVPPSVPRRRTRRPVQETAKGVAKGVAVPVVWTSRRPNHAA